jgi:formate dehydrogenase subunit gamma
LLPTGVAIITSPRLNLAPEWLEQLFRNLFGGTANLIQFHYTVGILWSLVLAFNVLVGFRRYFVPFSRERLFLSPDDIAWLKIKPLQMAGLAKDRELPPQDAYNAGQKLYMYIVILGTLGIISSGLIMTFHKYLQPVWMQWAQPLHWVSVGAIVAGLIIHVYMGAVFPEEKEAFFSMFTGEVSGWYARAHHGKWYWEKVQEELAWELKVREQVAGYSPEVQEQLAGQSGQD